MGSRARHHGDDLADRIRNEARRRLTAVVQCRGQIESLAKNFAKTLTERTGAYPADLAPAALERLPTEISVSCR